MFKTIRSRLLFFMTLVALVPVLVLVWLSYQKHVTEKQNNIIVKLTEIRDDKNHQIDDYLQHIYNQTILFSENENLQQAFAPLKKAFLSLGNTKSNYKTRLTNYYLNEKGDMLHIPKEERESYFKSIFPEDKVTITHQYYKLISPKENNGDFSEHTRKTDNYLSSMVALSGCQQALLIDGQSTYVLYSTGKETDFATQLKHENYKNSPLGQLYHRARSSQKGNVFFSDFSFNTAGQGKPILMTASPVYLKNKRIGVLILKWASRPFESILNTDNILGKTGECYLVGGTTPQTMRSNSKFLKENPSAFLINQKIKGFDEKTLNTVKQNRNTALTLDVTSASTQSAIQGKKGLLETVNYRKENVLSAYVPIKKFGLKWGLICEIEKEEAFADMANIQQFFLMITTILLTAVIFTVLGITYRLSLPFTQLLKAVKENEKSDNLPEIPVKGQDEAAQVAKLLNKAQSTTVVQKQQIKKWEGKFEETQKQLDERKEEVSSLNKIIEQYEESIYELRGKLKETKIALSTEHKTALQIQQTQLLTEKQVQSYFPSAFLLFQPLNPISNTLYWATQRGNRSFLFVADTKEEGTQSAFSTFVIKSLLNDLIHVRRISSADRIMDEFHKALLSAREDQLLKEDMCAGLCVYDSAKRMVEFAGANLSLYYISNGKLTEIQGDDYRAGDSENGSIRFTNHFSPVSKGKEESFFIKTSGFTKQKGEEGGIFGERRWKELLLDMHNLPMELQSDYFLQVLDDWKQHKSQTRDILITGFSTE